MFAIDLQPPELERRAALSFCGYTHREPTADEHRHGLWGVVYDPRLTAIIWAHGVEDNDTAVSGHLAVAPRHRHSTEWWRGVYPHFRLVLRGAGAKWLRVDEPKLFSFATRRLGFTMREGRPHIEL